MLKVNRVPTVLLRTGYELVVTDGPSWTENIIILKTEEER